MPNLFYWLLTITLVLYGVGVFVPERVLIVLSGVSAIACAVVGLINLL